MLTQFYPPYIGGEERHVRNLSLRLTERGHSVAVATLGNSELPDFAEEDGVRVYRMHGSMQRFASLFSESSRRHAPPFPDPELTLALRKIVQQERPEVVHAHNWLVHSYLPLKAMSAAPLVLTVHDHSIVCPKKKLIYGENLCTGPETRKCAGCAGRHYGPLKGFSVLGMHRTTTALELPMIDLFVPVSRATGEDNNLFDGKLPVEVIPNFVADDIGNVDPTPHELLAQLPDQPFIMFAGAFGRYKGLDVLIDAYRSLENTVPLVIIGYYTPEYPIRTKDFPPNVYVLRDWPHNAVMQAWQRCLFGVVPSTWSEPCPTVAMEAMACGRALIGTNLGGITDLIDDGVSGLLVPPDNVQALAQAMRTLIDDRQRCAQMGEAGKAKVVNFQSQTVLDRIENAYRRLMSPVSLSKVV